MKAWLVREKGEFSAAVVFAETRGKARVLAQSTDCCEDVNFLDIEVRRMKEADKYYEDGKWELNWLNSVDRIALVKDCGFFCDPNYWMYGDCENCSAVEWCDQYQERMADNG